MGTQEMLKKMARRLFKRNHLSLLLKLKVLTYFTPQRSVQILGELKADTRHTHPCFGKFLQPHTRYSTENCLPPGCLTSTSRQGGVKCHAQEHKD